MSIATTPIEKPMLDIVVKQVVSRFQGDSLALADCLVLLPNRRACQALKERFLSHLGGEGTLLLPQIQPIGEVDADMLWMQAYLHHDDLAEKLNAIPSTVSASHRLVAIAKELYRRRDDWPQEMITMDHAMRMAQDMAQLIDEMDRQAIDHELVLSLYPEQYAEHWQRSLQMLKAALRWLPSYYAQEGAISVVQQRNQMLAVLAEHWQAYPPQHPVIAAGSTGSQPATANLLKVVQGLPQGQVIIPGLDVQASDEVWDAIDVTHPQFHIKALLEALQIERGAVELLDEESVAAESYDRARLLLESSLPAGLTYAWHDQQVNVDALTDRFMRIDCEHEWEEARVVALLLRESLENPNAKAALITHDAELVERVSALMAEYEVEVNDTTARVLSDHPAVRLLLLQLHAAIHHSEPLAFLSSVKHPLSALSDNPRLVDQLEHLCFRGVRKQRDHLATLFFAANQEKVSDEDAAQLQALSETLKPLYQQCAKRSVSGADMAAMLRDLYAGEEDAVHAVLDDLASLEGIEPSQYLALLKRCLSAQRWFPPENKHARCFALSPMEARLQRFDRIVLSGLNEVSWPQESMHDSWFNPSMRVAIGLSNIQEHIGQQAQDWVTLAASTECFVTRSKRAGGAETIPSRFLARLDGYSKQSFAENNTHYAPWVRQLQAVDDVMPIDPPAPNPPLGARPTKLSVTRVETWLRDPYAIYAKYILKLEVHKAIDEEISASTLGTIVHELLEKFVGAVNDDAAALNHNTLDALLDVILKRYEDEPHVALIWSSRIRGLFDWIVAEESTRRNTATSVLAEEDGEMVVKAGGASMTITARMDRVEQHADGTSIIDYKVGTAPSKPDIERGVAPQLPLEALMINGDIRTLEYWKTGSGNKTPEQVILSDELDGLMNLYEQALEALIKDYLVNGKPYYAVPNPASAPRYNDYDYLERKQEWST